MFSRNTFFCPKPCETTDQEKIFANEVTDKGFINLQNL